MHVFPAEIPAAETRRADVVEVRVARKVAPLFGLGDQIPPFHRSWVCDFTALSLAEIGRGAPFPDRTDRSRLDAEPPRRPSGGEQPGWVWSGRSVWSPQQGMLPGSLTNATLNRYGPGTKAAVVLAGANRLLREATAAVASACRHLSRTGCDPEVRLAVWAGLVLEVYRAQPALVVAAVQARQVQRSLSAHWGTQVDRSGLAGADDAPSEIHPPSNTADGDADPDSSTVRWRPTSFDLVDSTLPELGLADDPAAGPGLVTVDALDDIASAWCQRLLGIGRPGRGVVWLTEDTGGSRRVHAMVRVGAVVAPFVAASLGGVSAGGQGAPPGRRGTPGPLALPVLPDAEALAALPVLHRRAHLLVAHISANYVRYRDELLLTWPGLRTQTRHLVAAAVQRCTEALDQEDPVALQLRAYAAYLDVWDQRRGGRHAVAPGGTASPDTATGTDETGAPNRLVAAAGTANRNEVAAAGRTVHLGQVATVDETAHPDQVAHPDQAADSDGAAGDGDGGRVAAVQRLIVSQQQVMDAWRSEVLDPGAAAYLLEIGIVALRDAAADPVREAAIVDGSGPGREATAASGADPVRLVPAADGGAVAGGVGPGYPGVDGPAPAAVRAWWAAILQARGLDPKVDLAALAGSLSDAQVFHLHHYAAWLASSGRRNDLRQALALQERVAGVRAEVTRREPAGFAAKSAAARAGYELAAEIATDLALATPERERRARTRALEDAVRHARAVLADAGTSRLLRPAGPQPATLRTARVAARALCVAASHGVTVDPADAAAAMELLDSAFGADRIGGTSGDLSGVERPGQRHDDAGSEPSGQRPEAAWPAIVRDWREQLAGVVTARLAQSG